MYEYETIVDRYTILCVDVLVKECQFPDSLEINYFAYFKTGDKYNMIKFPTQAGLRKAVSVAIHKWEFYKNSKFTKIPS